VASVVAVQRRVPISAEAQSLPAVAEAAASVGRIRPGQTFLVRCRRRGTHHWHSRDLERAVAIKLADLSGGVGEYETETDWRVSVEVYQDVAYVGVNSPSDLLEKPLRKERKYPPGERPLNRAQSKLREAFSAFGIEPPAGGRALDLGSAPGGWAAVLAETAREVIAVDPGDLDPRVRVLPNLRHLRLRAEALSSLQPGLGRFDIITSDMNLDPAESARIMCRLAPLLEPGAPAIMTVKYTTRRRRRHEREARSALSTEYEDIRMQHLPHNALETTAAMRRAGAGGETPK
jgi:tRNA acetyltransferase TAN1